MKKKMRRTAKNVYRMYKKDRRRWVMVQKRYIELWKEIMGFIEYNESNPLFGSFKDKSSLWYLGYLMAMTTKDIETDSIIARLEEGLEEGKNAIEEEE